MTLFLGQTYNGEFEIRDATGALAAPVSGPTLTVQVDGASTSTPVVINTTAVAGVYTYNFVIPNNDGAVLAVVLSATLTGSIPISAQTTLGVIQDSSQQGGSFSSDISKLSLYNDGLRRVGAERLASETEDVEVRYKLDEIWDIGAAAYCFRLAKPAFARKTSRLATTTTTVEHGLEQVHTLPGDFLGIVGLFADADLDQPVLRRTIEDGNLHCEYDTIWLRYVRDLSGAFTNWTADFANVVGAYLAWQLSVRISPDKAEALQSAFESEVEISLQLSDMDEPRARPQKSSTTLTNDWLPLYNEALSILYRARITTLTDERQDVIALHTAREGLLVRGIIEDHPWHFARKCVKIDPNTHLEPSFGYRNGFNKPTDILRFHGIFLDEFCQIPLKLYREENKVYYTDADPIYLDYIPSALETEPSSWPAYFWRYVAGALANNAKGQIPDLRPDADANALEQYKRRKSDAENNDFMRSPPQAIASGNWVRARQSGGGARNRTGSRGLWG